MELIKKNICIRDFQCKTNPCLVDGVVPYDSTCSGTTSHWGEVTGITSGGTIEYYNTGTTIYTSFLVTISILLTQNIDDLGIKTSIAENWVAGKTYYSGETVLYNNYSWKCNASESNETVFNVNAWSINNTYNGVNNTVNYIGETQINMFRRYTKKDSDKDLYNQITNSGYTLEIKNENDTYSKITGENKNHNNSKQNLYSYIIGYESGKSETTGIQYKDTINNLSNISYFTSGLTQENSVLTPSIKEQHLIGLVEAINTTIDVNIDRGVNTAFEKHLKFGDVSGLDDLEDYGNGYYNIKEI